MGLGGALEAVPTCCRGSPRKSIITQRCHALTSCRRSAAASAPGSLRATSWGICRAAAAPCQAGAHPNKSSSSQSLGRSWWRQRTCNTHDTGTAETGALSGVCCNCCGQVFDLTGLCWGQSPGEFPGPNRAWHGRAIVHHNVGCHLCGRSLRLGLLVHCDLLLAALAASTSSSCIAAANNCIPAQINRPPLAALQCTCMPRGRGCSKECPAVVRWTGHACLLISHRFCKGV